MSASLPRQAILVVNCRSRIGAEAFDEARAKLEAQGLKLVEAHRVDQPEAVAAIVQRAVTTAPMVIVGGGDGTLSSNIDYFKDRDTVFGILPLGTANSFARSLHIPLDLDGAVGVIAHGEPRRIDLGCINDDYFGNSAAIGLSPLIAKTVPPKLKKYAGRLGYALWAAKVGIKFQPFRLMIDDGETHASVWTTEVRIANGGYFGGVELVEGAKVDSGEIVIQIVTGKSQRSLLQNWVANMLKLRSRDQWQAEIRAKQLRLATDPPQDVTIDGELATRTPIDVRVVPAAVTIAAPKTP